MDNELAALQKRISDLVQASHSHASAQETSSPANAKCVMNIDDRRLLQKAQNACGVKSKPRG